MWQINSRSPCRNGSIVAVRQYDGGKAREVREMWPSLPIRSTTVDAADTRRDIADIGPHLALNVVIRRRARDAVISIQFVSRQQMQLTSGHETTLQPTRRLVGTDISRDISVESRTNIHDIKLSRLIISDESKRESDRLRDVLLNSVPTRHSYE